jgi:hypothetical protein
MKTTQCERVLAYIEDFGSITSLQAMQDLGCMRLASRINDLKRMGYPVRKRTVKAENRYGETVYFAEYYIEGERANE